MRNIPIITLFFLAITIPDTRAASDINTILLNLEAKMSGITTVETGFTQEKKLAVFNQPVILKGKIYIKKPELFSWHVQSPTRYAMLIKNDIIKQWDEDSGQVQQFSLSRNPGFSMAITQMRVWFSGAYPALLKDYTAKIISDSPVVLEFCPLESNPAAGIIKSVKVSFEEDERYLREIIIEEKNADITTLVFSSVKLNGPIDDSAWELKRDVQ